MSNFPELEIGLQRREATVYGARLSFRAPGDEARQDDEADVRLDPATLNRCWADPAAYGTALWQALFTSPALGEAWTKVRTKAAGRSLRIRLSLGESAVDLHRVRWEALRDPASGASLLTDQNVWFSRHLSSFDMRPVRLRAKATLRVLVAVASPSDLDNLVLGGRPFTTDEAFQAADEVTGLREALRDVTTAVTALPDPGAGPATFDNIVRHLREGYDIFYLLAHGALDAGAPQLLLVDKQGRGAVTAGADLGRELGQLSHPPRLVLLSSCQSAGEDRPFHDRGEAVLDAALGPLVGRAGIPAVVAMLGNVYQKTAREFVKTFFRELAKDGQIDRAVGEARHAVQDEPDFWSPVLYTRLVGGRLWYDRATGLTGRFSAWAAVLHQLKKGLCVPVLGSGLLEPFVGSTREIARRWAADASPPLAPHARDDLPQVAQYLSTTQKKAYLRELYVEDLTKAVAARWPAPEEAPVPAGEEPAELLRRLSAAAARLRARDPAEAHAVLARLNCPLYITTNADDLLVEALRAAGKAPAEQRCNWLKPADNPPGIPPNGPKRPTEAAPLVCQLFGHLSDPSSVVLTEDDYFKFLVGMSRRNARPEPSFVQDILARAGLLFLGFHLDDWDFRAFLHFFLSREAARTREQFGRLDVAVQLDPEDGRNADPDRVREYLEKLFGQANITIYWGRVEDFLGEVNDRWPATT